MNVVIDLSPGVQRRGGMGRYAEELARALRALDTPHHLAVFYADARGRAPRPPLDTLPRRTVRVGTKPWRMVVLLAALARWPMDRLIGPADLFHATDHLLPATRHAHTVFTLHDLAFVTWPETHLRSNRWFLRLAVPLFLRRADAVICPSRHTRDDAKRLYGVPESKLNVVPEGVDERFSPVRDPAKLAEVRARYRLPERFILSVGTLEPRKNHITLLRAYERLRANTGHVLKLVLAGRRGWKVAPFLDALDRSPARADIILAGEVADEDLPALYAAADLFVYPSLYEGFGLPPLEAMACGTPVVCSHSSSLPEVVADAGLLVDPLDAGGLAAAMDAVLSDDVRPRAMVAKGLARARLFTWPEAARRTIEVYEQTAASTITLR